MGVSACPYRPGRAAQAGAVAMRADVSWAFFKVSMAVEVVASENAASAP